MLNYAKLFILHALPPISEIVLSALTPRLWLINSYFFFCNSSSCFFNVETFTAATFYGDYLAFSLF